MLYDLANTVYAAFLTFLFTPFVTARFQEKGGLGITQTLSMLVAASLVPFLGALADRTARTRGYLAVATLLCIAAIGAFAIDDGKWWLLGCFFVANVTYNLGLASYNALLPSVADEQHAGRLSGIGVGVGYVGTILVLLVLLPLTRFADQALAAAALFLLLALPCLLLVRDRRTPVAGDGTGTMRAALRSLHAMLRELPGQPALLWFLLANFCLVDVLNTAVLYFADFTRDVFAAAAAAHTLSLFGHRYDGDAGLRAFLQHMGLALNGLALLFGVVLGLWTDRRPLGVLRCSAVALLLALVGGAAFGGASPAGYLLSLVALGALGLAGIWTAGRKVVVLLVPAERIGAAFGLYGITVKLSVLGSTVYGVVADHFGTRSAMLVQGVPLLVGLLCLSRVRLPGQTAAPQPA